MHKLPINFSPVILTQLLFQTKEDILKNFGVQTIVCIDVLTYFMMLILVYYYSRKR